MDFQKETKPVLIGKCKELGIKGYSGKSKPQIIELIRKHQESSAALPLEEPQSSIIIRRCDSDSSNENKSSAQDALEHPLNCCDLSDLSVLSDLSDLKFIDLFCGIGGFHQALNRVNATCVFASDIDEQCRKTYERNYGLKPHGDISKIDLSIIPEFDILCGGFPCQSFSNSGKKGGLSDKRGQLFEYILQIAVLKSPRFMFLENVKHILKIDDGAAFKHILKRIRETGYEVDTVELSPHQLGIPQQRERVVFICVRKDIYRSPVHFQIPDVPIDVDRIFQTDPEQTAKYRISRDDEAILTAWDEMIQIFEPGESMSPTILCNEFYTTYTEVEFTALPAWKQEYITKNRPIYEKYRAHWDAWYARHKTLITRKEIYGKLEWQAGKKKVGDSIFNQFIQLRQSGIRVKKREYFPTLVAIVQTPIYAKERRHITPRECARLQSFPDDFILNENDHTAYKQLGNAVNVDVVHFVISNTLRAYGVIS
jgi:DNA (cytosine-5)-methyltransferase 1